MWAGLQRKTNDTKKSFLPHINDLLITGSSHRTKRKTFFNKVMARITRGFFFFSYYLLIFCSSMFSKNTKPWKLKSNKLHQFFFQPGIKTRTACVCWLHSSHGRTFLLSSVTSTKGSRCLDVKKRIPHSDEGATTPHRSLQLDSQNYSPSMPWMTELSPQTTNLTRSLFFFLSVQKLPCSRIKVRLHWTIAVINSHTFFYKTRHANSKSSLSIPNRKAKGAAISAKVKSLRPTNASPSSAPSSSVVDQQVLREKKRKNIVENYSICRSANPPVTFEILLGVEKHWFFFLFWSILLLPQLTINERLDSVIVDIISEMDTSKKRWPMSLSQVSPKQRLLHVATKSK